MRNLSLFIVRKILQNKQSHFSKFIIKLSIVATAISVATMIITLSFVNGFQKTISDKIYNFWGYIHIQKFELDKSLISEEAKINKCDSCIQQIAQYEGITHINPYITKSAVLKNGSNFVGILLKGIDYLNINNYRLQEFVVTKKTNTSTTAHSTYSIDVYLSQKIADNLKVQLGDTVQLYCLYSSNNQEQIIKRKVSVCGIYKTGIDDYDELFVWADIKLVQKLNHWQANDIGGYEIYLSNPDLVKTINDKILEAPIPIDWVSKPVDQIFPNLFAWLSVQNTNRNVLIFIMGLIAMINLVTCLIILVLEKYRMIGLLKALGMNNRDIQKIFLYYAFYISVIGIIIGLAIGILFSLWQQYFPFIRLDEHSYFVNTAPILICWGQVFAVCMGTIFVCFFFLIIPTFVIKHISPIQSLEFK
ncbi:MAG: ABC transporter permease [Phycisphaerales bacterium]|nr:ABC transporter permease [Phycisphaerales bacterium]